jgi:hypothetical protein
LLVTRKPRLKVRRGSYRCDSVQLTRPDNTTKTGIFPLHCKYQFAFTVQEDWPHGALAAFSCKLGGCERLATMMTIEQETFGVK